MTRMTLVVELEYDAEDMHGEDLDAMSWFLRDVIGGPLRLISDEIGDTVGDITVIGVKAS